jgi:hypothetical protein
VCDAVRFICNEHGEEKVIFASSRRAQALSDTSDSDMMWHLEGGIIIIISAGPNFDASVEIRVFHQYLSYYD